jgi:hypothetical protein
MNKAEKLKKALRKIYDIRYQWNIGAYNYKDCDKLCGEVVQLYADEHSREQLDKFGNYVDSNYQEGDHETKTVFDWIFEFNQQK